MEYQLFQNKLKKLETMGFIISWKLIDIGLYGYDEIQVLLTREEVLEYLDSLLIDNNEQADNIVALICAKEDCTKFDKLLKQFSDADGTDSNIQKRKWRTYLLKTLLDNLSKDYLQGILELMEFWISMGISENCPHTFPENNSKGTVQNYFSQSSYAYLVDKNLAWLNDEVTTIINLES